MRYKKQKTKIIGINNPKIEYHNVKKAILIH